MTHATMSDIAGLEMRELFLAKHKRQLLKRNWVGMSLAGLVIRKMRDLS
jgi:hypothetical protein